MTCTLIPDDAGAENQRHRRHQHQAVVHITYLLQRLVVKDVEPEQRTRTQQLAEESHDNQNLGISQTVAHTVEEGLPRTVLHGKRFQTSHEDTVCDNQTYVYGKLYAYIIGKSLQNLTYNSYQRRNYYQLNDDTDAVGNSLAQQ